MFFRNRVFADAVKFKMSSYYIRVSPIPLTDTIIRGKFRKDTGEKYHVKAETAVSSCSSS